MARMMYDFKCSECGWEHEKLVDADTKTTKCPVCGTMAERQLSAPGGFKFNGGGFYETDFKGKK